MLLKKTPESLRSLNLGSMITTSSQKDYSKFLLLALSCLVFFALTVRVLYLTDYSFNYSLDDPYVHLALSDQIAQGHYGLVAGKPASPSSSILYPFLLAIFSRIPCHVFVPLILGWIALIASILTLRRIGSEVKLRGWQLITIVFLVAATCNLFGLPFNGMEHGLHVAITLWVLYGVFKLTNEKSSPRFFLVALILCPLLRYEGLSVTVAGIMVLICYCRWYEAGAVTTILIILMGSFSVMLAKLGLPLLPHSVLLKSGMSTNQNNPSLLHIYSDNAIHSLGDRQGVVLLMLWLISLVGLLLSKNKQTKGNNTLAAFVSIIVLGHVVFGHFGWFGRYEIYAFIVTLIVAFWAWRDSFVDVIESYPFRSTGLLAVFLVLIGAPYIEVTLKTPEGAQDIYLQQAQMRKFTVEYYHNAVAVNDIGLLSYRNPYSVVDLWGLGYGRPDVINQEWMTQQVNRNNVGIVMIYREWFNEAIPFQWVHLGDLKFQRNTVSVANNTVQFYLTEIGDLKASQAALYSFIDHLPSKTQFVTAN